MIKTLDIEEPQTIYLNQMKENTFYYGKNNSTFKLFKVITNDVKLMNIRIKNLLHNSNTDRVFSYRDENFLSVCPVDEYQVTEILLHEGN